MKLSTFFTTSACLIIALVLGACEKYEDKPGPGDPRLSRPYCNTPDAVNYNWDFPGTPDSTVCFFPSDVFKGHYTFTDSVYNGSNSLVLQQPLTFDIYAISRTKIALVGFCGNTTDSIRLTSLRTFRSQVDTTILNGQQLCRAQDTLSGYIANISGDSANHVRFFFTVVSDTGITYHQGTAIRH